MKKFKKLIPAFCAMLVSAAMLGTSTYAWFSVNKKVEATGMSVTAQANTQYFAVLNSLDGGKFTTGKTDVKTSVVAARTQNGTANTTAENKEQYVNPISFTTEQIAQEGLTAIAANKWYTANINEYNGIKPGMTDDTDSSVKYQSLTYVGDATTATATTVYTKGEYFVGYTFYVGVADDTANFEGYLKFEATVSNGVTVAGVKVNGTVKGGSAATDAYVPLEDFVSDNAKTKGFTAGQYNLNSKTEAGGDATYVAVTVYVFIDGTAENVKDSSTVAQLTGSVSVSVTGFSESEYNAAIE